MYYCEACAIEREWPVNRDMENLKTTECEVCGKWKLCNNVPSYLLEGSPRGL